MTDDQTLASFKRRTMPYTTRLFRKRGTTFTQAIASPPLCCPSRAGFLTGQYPHNHGVDANVPGYRLLREPRAVLPVWLQAAGYETGFAGKYLNEYELVGGAEPAPGWDSWFAALGYPAYFDYEVSDDGRRRTFGSDEDDYSTDVLADRAVEFVSTAPPNRPFFFWLALNAPHIAGAGPPPCGEAQPQPRTSAELAPFAELPLPRDPSFNEADVSDKPAFIQETPPLDARTIERLELRWRCGAAALRAADEAMERLVGALEDAGELDETVLVFTSDNGYFFGEHGIDDDKRLPYEPSIRVPLAMLVPRDLTGGERVPTVDRLVANIDLAPTLLDLAGASACPSPRACRFPDGLSMRPLLESSGEWPRDRLILLELDDGFTYSALRTERYLYSELTADRGGPLPEPEIELYDVRRDPSQLHNLWAEDRAASRLLRRRLRLTLKSLRGCRGILEGPTDDFPTGPLPCG